MTEAAITQLGEHNIVYSIQNTKSMYSRGCYNTTAIIQQEKNGTNPKKYPPWGTKAAAITT